MAEQPIPEPQPVPLHLHPHVKGELRGEELVITVTIGNWRGERLKVPMDRADPELRDCTLALVNEIGASLDRVAERGA